MLNASNITYYNTNILNSTGNIINTIITMTYISSSNIITSSSSTSISTASDLSIK